MMFRFANSYLNTAKIVVGLGNHLGWLDPRILRRWLASRNDRSQFIDDIVTFLFVSLCLNDPRLSVL